MNLIQKYIFALIIYSPTLVLFPQTLIYVLISFIGFISWINKIEQKGFSKLDIKAIVFLIISTLIYIIGKSEVSSTQTKSINDILPYSFFIITSIYFSKLINKEILKIVLYFIIFETLSGLLQYKLGIQYFIKPISIGEHSFGDSEYLYYNKVYGLSYVTSIFALKIFIGTLLTYYLDFSNKVKTFFIIILILGLLISFNRTSIVAFFTFCSLIGYSKFRGRIGTKLLIFIIIGIILTVALINLNFIKNQFFRGDEIDLSGRDFIFQYYINFISENFIFGNFFTKHWAELTPGSIYHAHNSYLQTLANMGGIMGTIIILFFIRQTNSKNYIFVIPILVYSGFQFGILWGVSFADIIFFYFLFNTNLKNLNNK